MAQVPFSQAVEILEAAGYSIHHRTKYPRQSEAYFYFFMHQDRIHPGIGFPVHGRMVQGRYYELILDALKGSNTNENDEDESARDYQPGDKVLRAARKALATYTLVIEPDSQLCYIGWAKELSTVFADGPTPEDCVAALKFSLESALSAMLEERLELPRPISEAKRTQQVNIRLTPYEKQLLMRESAKRGFRGISDLIRAQTIDKLLAS